jgi:hypothetical protein
MTRLPSRTSPRLTRRKVLVAAATVGAGATAASVAGLSAARENTAASSDALVISLRDAKSGTFDLFAGRSRMTIKDPELAARLLETVKRG